jgi:hypothetical protein
LPGSAAVRVRRILQPEMPLIVLAACALGGVLADVPSLLWVTAGLAAGYSLSGST